MTDTPVRTEDMPRIPEGDLASDRVRRPGDIDLDAVTDDTGTPGNNYPQSYSSAEGEAKAAQAEVDRLEAELAIAKDLLQVAQDKVDYLSSDAPAEPETETTIGTTGTTFSSGGTTGTGVTAEF